MSLRLEKGYEKSTVRGQCPPKKGVERKGEGITPSKITLTGRKGPSRQRGWGREGKNLLVRGK